jgi:hypothetical protein
VARPKPSDKKSSGVADNAPSRSKATAPWMVTNLKDFTVVEVRAHFV